MNPEEAQTYSYQNWLDVELMSAATVDRQNFRPEALDAIEAELARREIDAAKLEAYRQRRLKSWRFRQTTGGIGGWLLLFIILVFVYSALPLFHAVSLLLKNSVVDLELLAEFLVGGYGLFAVAQLILKKPRAPFHAKCWLIADLLLRLFGTDVALWKEAPGSPIGEICITVLGLAYLDLSKRVAVTYRDGGEDAEPVVETSPS